jgi:DNA-binding beta-propeller fold protein YncE
MASRRFLPCGLVVVAAAAATHADTLLVSGYNSDSVGRYIAPSGAFIELLDETAGLDGAQSVTRGPDGLLYVCSENNNRVLRYQPHGLFVDVFVNPGNGLNGPTGAIFGPDASGDGHEDLYVASFNSDAILLYDGRTGAFLSVFVAPGSGGLNGPDAGMTFGPDGHLYVPSFWNSRVLRYDGGDGSFIDEFVSAASGGLNWPRTIVFRPTDGHALVSSEGSDRVNVYDGVTGEFLETLIGAFPAPTGMAFGPDGTLYVASIALNAVHRFDAATGTSIDEVVSGGAGGVSAPTFVALLVEGDVDGDGRAGVDDLLDLLHAWGPCPDLPAGCPADLNGSGEVDSIDLLTLIFNWSS